MEKDFVIPIAVGPEGSLVPPHKAEKGILYHCPECRDKIVFRKGEIKIPHFAHHGDSECNPETILHKAGKLCIVQAVLGWKAGTSAKPVVLKAHEVCAKQSCYDLPESIERSLMEHRIPSGRVLDVALMGPQSIVLGVEIFVTHRVDAAKKSAIYIPWIELDAQALLDSPTRWFCRQESGCFPHCDDCEAVRKAREEEVIRFRDYQEKERARMEREAEALRSRAEVKSRYVTPYSRRLYTGPVPRAEPVRLEWDHSVQKMVARLKTLGPAKEGFDLGAGMSVLDPVKYHKKMLDEAAAGPTSTRSQLGSFQDQLRLYLKARGESI